MNLPQRRGLHVPLPTRWQAHRIIVIEQLSRHCDIGWMIHEVAIFRGARFLATKEALLRKLWPPRTGGLRATHRPAPERCRPLPLARSARRAGGPTGLARGTR